MTATISRWQQAAGAARLVFWLALLAVLAQMTCSGGRLAAQRSQLLDRFQQERKSRVIAMIHREDTVTLFGVPVSKEIDIEDSEAVLRAIRLTPDEQPIDLVLHTPGGLVLAAEQIAHALVEHKGKVTAPVTPGGASGKR